MIDSDFSKEDLALIGNEELLLRKRILQDKIYNLLDLTSRSLSSSISTKNLSAFPPAKISRGENYMGLPYLILDYPSLFKNEDILAFRTMFLWGNFFSTTIHLQGHHLEGKRESIIKICQELDPQDLFVSCGETPWHYHYKPDNYLQLTPASLSESVNRKFFKLSRKISISDHADLPKIVRKFYSPFIETFINTL